MKQQEFMELREELNSHCTNLLGGAKLIEYASDEKDRLSQFKRIGAVKDCHPVQALCGMMVKHETSIHDMANALDKGKTFDRKSWVEKIGDLRNYCDLMYALLIELGEI